MKSEHIMLKVREGKIQHILTYTQNIKKKKKTHTEIESRLVVARIMGGGGGKQSKGTNFQL